MIQLENDRLRVSVSQKGAELTSLFDKRQAYEWLWQADPAHWAKHAPVLFPFIGCVKDGTYSHKGQTYPMTKHGFARDLVFEIESQEQDELCMVLKSSEKTLSMYPFDFELRLHYRLEANGLSMLHEVKNTGMDKLYFSLGGHPAFNCAMDTEHWRIAFEHPENLESTCIDLKSGLILDTLKPLGNQVSELPLSRGLFEEDALIFEHLSSKKVMLIGPAHWQQLTFEFGDFPTLAFWTPSATQAPFICLEPWFGMADKVTHRGILSEKYGVVALEAGQALKAEMMIKLTGE